MTILDVFLCYFYLFLVEDYSCSPAIKSANMASYFPSSSDLNRDPSEMFSAGLISDDDVYKWEVIIVGPADTF